MTDLEYLRLELKNAEARRHPGLASRIARVLRRLF
jgi:hypothetical protein